MSISVAIVGNGKRYLQWQVFQKECLHLDIEPLEMRYIVLIALIRGQNGTENHLTSNTKMLDICLPFGGMQQF